MGVILTVMVELIKPRFHIHEITLFYLRPKRTQDEKAFQGE